jgi:hypothetical protein
MRARNAWMLVAALVMAGSSASADKQTDELTTGYEKESGACALQAGGVAKVADGAVKLQESLTGPEHDALDADVAKLTSARGRVDAYCAELAAALEILHANPGAKYKSLERQLDEHDNKIRHARADAKKAIAEVEPVIHALVPRINLRNAPQQEPEKHAAATVKFPSGRSVMLPPLGGTWKTSGTPTSDTADYAEAGKVPIAASVWTRPFDAATCDQEKRAAVGATLDEPTKMADAASVIGTAWIARGVVKDTHTVVLYACLADNSPPGGWMGYVTITPDSAAAKLAEQLEDVMIQMLGAQVGRPIPLPEPPH